MAPLLQWRPSTGWMKECWASLSSSPSLSLSLIDMWNLGLSLAKGDREKARERDREKEKRPRSPSGALESCWALSGQRLTQTIPSLPLFLWPRLQSSALWLTTLFLYFCVNLPVIFLPVLTCQSIWLFVLLSVSDDVFFFHSFSSILSSCFHTLHPGHYQCTFTTFDFVSFSYFFYYILTKTHAFLCFLHQVLFHRMWDIE